MIGLSSDWGATEIITEGWGVMDLFLYQLG